MKCENIIQKYLEEEDGRFPSFIVRLHMLFCSKCRNEIRNMRLVFFRAQRSSSFLMPADLCDVIMQKIFNANPVQAKDMTSLSWIFAGAVIIISIFIVSFNESFIWISGHLGSELAIYLNIVLGLAITILCATYIATHLDQLKKLAEIINHKIH